MNAQEQALIGQQLVYTAQAVPALVVVRDVRSVYGNVRYHVEDCLGELRWVNRRSCSSREECLRAGGKEEQQ